MRVILAIVLAVTWLVAGCKTATRPDAGSVTAVESKAAAAESGVPADDYSPAAVERRTEAHARYATGFLYELGDQPEKAVEEYLKAATEDIGNEMVVLETAARLMRSRQTEKAVELLKQATAEPDASGLLFSQLGLAYSLLGKKDLAIAANRDAIKRSPMQSTGYRHLAQIYLQDGKAEEGIKVLEEAAKQTDVDALFLTELGEFCLAFAKSGPNDAARELARSLMERAVAQNPGNPIVIQKLAEGFAYLGNIDASVQLYLKLFERFPNLPGIHEKLAELYLRKQDKERAAEQLQSIIKNHPTNPQAYYLLGSIYYDNKKLKEAIEQFNKVILLNPGFEPAYYDLAGAQINLNQPEAALQLLQKVRDKFKPGFVCEFYTALAYTRMKQYTNALKALVAAEIVARATETNRLNHLFYFQLGAAHERNQQFEEAEKAFRKCLALSPDFSEALNYLGYMWAERGVNLAEAHDLIAKAVKQEPENSAFLDSLGWVLFKLGKPSEALPYLQKAVALSEEPDPTLQDHLGDVFLTLGQADQALAAWRKALTIEPNEHKEQIRKKLDELERKRTQSTP